jgi:hypothetical protein
MNRNADLIVYGIVNNALSKFDLEDYRILLIILLSFIYGMIPYYFKIRTYNYIKNKIFNKPYSLIFSCKQDNINDFSDRFQALINFINENSDPRIATEINAINRYSNEGDDKIFQISQPETFIVNKELGIKGEIYVEKENTKNKHEEIVNKTTILTLTSYITNAKKMIKWIDEITEKFINKQKSYFEKCQMFCNVCYEKGFIRTRFIKFESNITFDTNYFPCQKEIMERIDFFINKEDFFKEKGIKRSLNFLFSGEPGTGKTGLIKAIANYTKRHILMLKISPDFPISDIDNILSGFINKNSIFDIKNIIFVIEEIDLISTSFNNRETIETVKIEKDKDNSKEKNALSVILNALDGIPESNGRMIIMTTNCPEKLDSAIKRPGRTEHYHIGKLSKNDVFHSLKLFWGKDFHYQNNNLKDDIDMKYTAAELMRINLQSNFHFKKIKNLFIKS